MVLCNACGIRVCRKNDKEKEKKELSSSRQNQSLRLDVPK